MLQSLQIENYALINSLHIQFDEGFTAITGETGAGKSIIMGALALILGNRADTSVLYDKQRKCFVEAIFDVSALDIRPFFENHNLDYQTETILRREISETGKSRAFINDTPVNLLILKELTSKLLDIHSQHQNLLFQDADFRVQVLDQFAQTQPDLADYHAYLSDYKSFEKELAELSEKQRTRLERKDFLEFVFKELSEAKLVENEQDELEKRIDFLTHAETIKGNLFAALQLLSENENSVVDQLREIKNLCASVSSYSTEIEKLSERIESDYIELKDVVSEVIVLEDKVEFNPAELELLKQRLDLIYNLEQKNHVTTVAALMQKMREIDCELSEFSDDEEKIKQLVGSKNDSYLKAENKAKAISEKRKKCIPQLEKQIISKIHSLGIPDGQFVIKIDKTEVLHKNGIDNVQFLFSGNKGVALSELEKVASGGEISRLMLAVKSTISDKSVLPTVIFDEIDVGISGEIAGKVANLMKEMAQSRQLLVITHLPQIAAKCNAHYQVYKQIIDNKSFTNIKQLNSHEREVEIAQMMSGEKYSEAALMAAKELIEQ